MKQQEHSKPHRELREPWPVQAFQVVLVLYWVLYAAAILFRTHSAGELKTHFGLYATHVLRDFRLWEMVTYSFLHDNLFLLLFNTAALLLVAGDLEQRWGAWRFLFYTLATAIGGAVFSCLVAETGEAFGASGVVMAVFLAIAVLLPDRTYFGVLRGKHLCWLVLVVQAIACLFLLDEDRAQQIRRLPHLALVFGGLAAGWMFIRSEPGVHRAFQVWLRRRHIRRKREMVKVRRRVDELLEKIKFSGIEQLSRKERSFLVRASRLFRKEMADESEFAHRE